MNELPRIPIPEAADVNELAKNLEALGWKNGENFGLEEYMMLEGYLFDRVFEEQFYELNRQLLEDLEIAEKNEVLTYVKDRLRNAPEEKVLEYIKYGIEYTVKRKEKRKFKLVDFENIERNSLIYAKEIKYPGSPDNIRPDITLFVNGIPLGIIEAKRGVTLDSEEEAVRQIRRYQQEAPELFRLVQVGVAYGHEKFVIPTFPNWERRERHIPGLPWKVEVNGRKVESIEHFLMPETFLNVIRWFTFYRCVKEGEMDKIISRYNQYIASEKSLRRIEGYLEGKEEKNGLIWHWQGSGKSYTMFYIANRFFEEFFSRNPIVLMVVDRIDLQEQLLNNFLKGLKAPKFKNYLQKISSIEELKREIETIKRSEYEHGVAVRKVYVVLIQKFKMEELMDFLVELGERYLEHLKSNDVKEYNKLMNKLISLGEEERKKKLVELGGIHKKEILIIIDEAHRSQYGLLAAMMKNVFPNSMRFAFTGTPVFKPERNTFKEFAYPEKKEYYLDVYFIKDSIDDGFTLPIVYDVVQEGKHDREGIRILLQDEEIRSYIDSWKELLGTGEEYDIDEEETSIGITKREIRRQLNKVRVFLTNEERLKKLANYIAERVEKDTEKFRFKAMVVAANRKACVLLKKHLDKALMERYGEKYGDEVKYWTEIVMTYQHNDTGELLNYREELIKRRGKRDTHQINRDIQREFKEENNPKILIVTDMLITGFDAPVLKVMYLDKPMLGHKLLQTIARVNRPYKDGVMEKKQGLIVDSVGVLRAVKESLKQYELIKEMRIAKDLEENILKESNERMQEFKTLLGELKEELKGLKRINPRLEIDVDHIKEVFESKDMDKKREIIEDMDSRAKLIAMYWDTSEVHKILIDLRDLLYLFKALGAHPDTVYYANDISVLAALYSRILYYIRGRKMPQEFWDGLIELIHQKTVVDDFKKIMKTEFTGKALAKAMELLKKAIIEKKPIPEHRIADAYRLLKALLEGNLSNPVYREIHERIEKKRREWIERNADTDDFVIMIAKAMEDVERYNKDIASKPLVDRVTNTVSMLINERFAEKGSRSLNLKNLRNVLKELEDSPRITTDKIKKIRTELLKDLIIEVRRKYGVSYEDIKKFANELTRNYIVEEIRKAKRSEGVAG